MPHVTINIKSILPASVQKRQSQLQIIADTLDDNSLRVLTEIVEQTERINNKLAANENTLKQAIKSI